MPTTSRGPSGRSRPSGPRLSSRASRSSTTDAPSSASASTTSTAPPQAAVGGSTDSDDSPRSSLTTRSAVLLGVLAILAASYALPVRAWLDQRAQIAEVAAERTELASEVADLQAALDLWDDAAYVRRRPANASTSCFPARWAWSCSAPRAPRSRSWSLGPWYRPPRVTSRGGRPCCRRSPRWATPSRHLHQRMAVPRRTTRRDDRERPRRRSGLRAARPARSRRAGRRAPMPLRAARRRGDRTTPARRHAVPDDVLPDVPAGMQRDRHAGGLGPHGHDDPAAGRRPAARGGVPGRTRALPRRARSAGRGAGDRRGVGGGHAHPGQVPARARRPGPGVRPRVNPLGDQALAELGSWWDAGACVDVPDDEAPA